MTVGVNKVPLRVSTRSQKRVNDKNVLVLYVSGDERDSSEFTLFKQLMR